MRFMIRHLSRLLLLPSILCFLFLADPARALAWQEPDSRNLVSLTVDTTDLPRRLLHSKMIFAVQPGPFALVYPKWVPGAHGPHGPIGNIGGLKLTAAGKEIPWRRNSLDLYAFECQIPEGASTLEAELLFVPPPRGEPLEVSLGVVASRRVLVLNWNALLLYPKGKKADELSYTASIALPPGWQCATALPRDKNVGATQSFSAVTLTRLIDSPLLAGQYLHSYPLTLPGDVPHFLDVVGETPALVDLKPALVEKVSRLAAEAGALFGTARLSAISFPPGLERSLAQFRPGAQ